MLNSRNVLNLKVSLLITARLLLNAMKSTMAYRWGVAAAEPGAAAAAAKADAAAGTAASNAPWWPRTLGGAGGETVRTCPEELHL